MSKAPDLARTDYLRDVSVRLLAAGHGQKGKIVAAAAEYLSISKAELYRELESVGYVSGRKTRSDKGKSAVSAEVAEMIGGMVHVATRANGKRTLPINVAHDILAAQGKAPNVSAATIGRMLRQHNAHPKQLATPSAHTQQRSLHPNHVWQVDASVCVLFYLPKGGMQVMDEAEFYKNKPANIKKIENDRVIRYVITDHFSGWVYAEYVAGSESSENLTTVFLNAIQKRSAQEPMHGVPFILYADKGCANTSGMFKNLLTRLDISFIAHAAKNSRAKGQVENANNLVETQFEGRLRFKNITSIDQLNTEVEKWRAFWNETKVHSRTKRTRNQVWNTIRPEQLRIAPPLALCQELVSTVPVSRTVTGNLTIPYAIKGYGSNDYDVRHIDGVYPKAKLDIVVNPYRAPCIDVMTQDSLGNAVVYTVEPMQRDWVGFAVDAPVIGASIKSMPDSVLDSSRKRIIKQAYNANTQAEADKAIKKKQAAYDGMLDVDADIKQVQVPDYIPRAGEQMQTIQQKRELTPLNLIEAAREIKGLVGELWTTDNYKALATSYPDNQVPPDAIRAIADAIKSHAQPRPTLKVVGAN